MRPTLFDWLQRKINGGEELEIKRDYEDEKITSIKMYCKKEKCFCKNNNN